MIDHPYPFGYNPIVNTLLQSDVFADWLARLRDPRARARILDRLDSAALGHFGDCECIGEDVFEMRIHFGPGYRVYYTRRGSRVYFLLISGDKGTQKRDIKAALKMMRRI